MGWPHLLEGTTSFGELSGLGEWSLGWGFSQLGHKIQQEVSPTRPANGGPQWEFRSPNEDGEGVSEERPKGFLGAGRRGSLSTVGPIHGPLLQWQSSEENRQNLAF